MDFRASWVQGYGGTEIFFIDGGTVAFICGRHVKFYDTRTSEESVYAGVNEAISSLAVDRTDSVFAVSETSPQPRIHVVSFPSFDGVSTLEDGAILDYHAMAFGASETIASVSTHPEFRLTVWNYSSGQQLCHVNLNPRHVFDPSTTVSFSPVNSNQLCLTTRSDLLLWNVERSDEKYLLVKEEINLPANDGSDPLGDAQRATSLGVRRRTLFDAATPGIGAGDADDDGDSREKSSEVQLPEHAVAGVVGDVVTKLTLRQSPPLCRPVSHAWLPKGDLLVGCVEGQLLRVNVDERSVNVIFRPVEDEELTAGVTGRESKSSTGGATASVGASAVIAAVNIRPNSFRAMALHRDGLYVGGNDGILRLLDVSSPSEISVLGSQSIGAPISTLTFDAEFSSLVVGSPHAIQRLDVATQNLTPICDDGDAGDFVGVVSPAPEHLVVVSARASGLLQTWDRVSGRPLGAINVVSSSANRVTCLAASPAIAAVVCGLSSGHLCVLDYSQAANPRLVLQEKLHRGPLLSVGFDPSGVVMATGSVDGNVYVLSAAPSSKFEVLGFVGGIAGAVLHLGLCKAPGLTTDTDNMKVIGGLNPSDSSDSCQKVVVFKFPMAVVKAASRFHETIYREFDEATIHKTYYDLPVQAGAAIRGLAYKYFYHVTNPDHFFVARGKYLLKLEIPPPPPVVKKGVFDVKLPSKIFAGHTVDAGGVRLTPGGDWLVSFGGDGYVSLRRVDGMESAEGGAVGKVFSFRPHDFRRGAVVDVCVTPDLNHIYTVGADGVLASYRWKGGSGKLASEDDNAVDAAFSAAEVDRLPRMREVQARPVSGPPESGRSSDSAMFVAYNPEEELTWIEQKKADAIKEEDKLYAQQKTTLRNEIEDVKKQLKTMMDSNFERLRFEQLGRDEFELDMDEKAKIGAEAADRYHNVREEIRYENLAKMYRRDLIKQECWDAMTTKGRSLKAFNSTLVVSNYPMRERKKEELTELEFVKRLRRVEKEEVELRKEFLAAEKQAEIEDVENEDVDGEGEEEEEEEDEGPKEESPAIQGSLGAEYGGESDLFYSQFDLHTRSQKLNQTVLLQDAIFRIKTKFNEEFDHVFMVKEQQILKIQEKNRRIKKILQDLDIRDREINDPELGPEEKPEMLLTVADEEVKVEKYISAEMRAYLAEQARLREEERLAKLGDNARERALESMMGGVLEVKKEDELKKDIPPPQFVVEAKPEDEWSEEEQRLFKEYEKKVKDLAEEREKFKKQLETELKKVQVSILESVQQFDELHTQLFLKKVKTEMVISHEEMKILRLRKMLLTEDEIDVRERELGRLLGEKRTSKAAASAAVNEARKLQEGMRDQYDILMAEDKVMEKTFRREFADCSSAMIDQLAKLYKRRPRGKGIGVLGAIVETMTASEGGNPYGERPTSSQRREMAAASLEAALLELDSLANKPENCSPDIWERLCQVRRAKIESEQMIKQKALVLAQMTAFTGKRQDEDEKLKREIETVVGSLSNLNETRLRFNVNNQVQLLMKQGQVEIDMSVPIYNYSNTVLVHRNVVEELNTTIRSLGESKILSMVESKDFRKGIVQLEWEQKKCQMKMEDLCERARDIQMLKVTREIQSFLASDDYEAKKAQEIQSLEEALILQDRNNLKEIRQQQKVLREKQKAIETKMRENSDLDAELESLNVNVNERRHVNDATASDSINIEREKRMKNIIQRRRLVELAKSQAQEVAVLRAEVERKRMSTFPALVQLEQ